jgi:hypothetical protein
MRILGFSKKWAKLSQSEFTTFRYRRKDADRGRDWHNGETLKIVYHPRHEHEFLGIAQIINKEIKQCQMITEEEAQADGFQDIGEMMEFLNPPAPAGMQIINKLTLRWLAPSGQE